LAILFTDYTTGRNPDWILMVTQHPTAAPSFEVDG